jgi:Tfp pilus assembly protein PilV
VITLHQLSLSIPASPLARSYAKENSAPDRGVAPLAAPAAELAGAIHGLSRPAMGWKSKARPGAGYASGMTLTEIMIAFGLFSIMALGSLTALLQTRKMSEDNVAQATAAVIAQGIIEQVQLNGYDAISDTVGSPNLELKFTGANTNNLASIQQYDLPWATDTTTFTAIGARVDPNDTSSAVLGVLLDLDYKVGTKVVRPGRYMKMRVNIRRTVHSGDDNVEIVLVYQWQPPSRNTRPTDNIYLTREIRTIRSQAPSY